MEELKGFIEVTNEHNIKYTLNINYVISFCDKCIYVKYNADVNYVKESYEEIKQLIKNAQ